jgi:hypothetical protein
MGNDVITMEALLEANLGVAATFRSVLTGAVTVSLSSGLSCAQR